MSRPGKTRSGQSGQTAVTALAAALAGSPGVRGGARRIPPGDSDGVLIISDAGNHASLIDGCRLAKAHGARLRVTPHGDLAAVEQALRGRAEQAAIVITDAVFSVAGDLAPVARLHALARAHGAILLVDEAHSLGVLGTGGRGTGHDTGLAGEPDLVRTVTLSKALSGQGVSFAVPGNQLVAFVVVAVVAGLLAAIAPARRASRLKVLESLQYE